MPSGDLRDDSGGGDTHGRSPRSRARECHRGEHIHDLCRVRPQLNPRAGWPHPSGWRRTLPRPCPRSDPAALAYRQTHPETVGLTGQRPCAELLITLDIARRRTTPFTVCLPAHFWSGLLERAPARPSEDAPAPRTAP